VVNPPFAKGRLIFQKTVKKSAPSKITASSKDLGMARKLDNGVLHSEIQWQNLPFPCGTVPGQRLIQCSHPLHKQFLLLHANGAAYEQDLSTLRIPLVICFHTPITLVISPSVHKIRNSMLCHFLSANIERIVDIFFCTDMISIFNIGSPTVYATNTTNCTINTQHRSSRRR